MDAERMPDMVSELVHAKERVHEAVLRRVGSRNSQSAGVMEVFKSSIMYWERGPVRSKS